MKKDKTDDLDGFEPSPPSKKLDDKAAQLELENAYLKANFNKERVTYHFVIGLLLNLFVWSSLEDQGVKYLCLTGTTIVLFATARWLDHKWLGDSLGRWNDLFYNFVKKKMLGTKIDSEEPIPKIENEKNF